MAVRASMQYIIDFVHTLIDVPDATPMADQEIQDMLDLNRLDVYQKRLTPGRTMSSTGDVEYHDFYATGFPFWENGVVIQDRTTGATKTPDDINNLLGRWSFTAAQQDCLVITGRTYNVYYAASKLAAKMVQKLRADFNFTADGLTVQKIAQINDLRTLATDLATKGWSGMTTIKMVRKDLTGERDHWWHF